MPSVIGFIAIDIDSFKQYNEHYGHQAGDECLRRVAEILDGQIMRAGDQLASYGGEEFGVILPNTDSNGVAVVAEKLRMAVADAHILHEFSDVSNHVTISLGCAAITPTLNARYETLIEQAGQALYMAKKSGRNQFQVYARRD